MIEFNLFGMPVRIQPWFWITMALIGSGLWNDDASSRENLLKLVYFIAAGFISILIHELGHALSGKCFGARPEITLQAFGGYALFPGSQFSRMQDFVVTMCGPAVQFILGMASLILTLVVSIDSELASHFFSCLTWVSLVWSIINLMPVLPLDGGRLLNAVMGPKRLKVTLIISIITATLAAVGMFLAWREIFFSIFLASFAWQNWQMLQQINGRPSDPY